MSTLHNHTQCTVSKRDRKYIIRDSNAYLGLPAAAVENQAEGNNLAEPTATKTNTQAREKHVRAKTINSPRTPAQIVRHRQPTLTINNINRNETITFGGQSWRYISRRNGCLNNERDKLS